MRGCRFAWSPRPCSRPCPTCFAVSETWGVRPLIRTPSAFRNTPAPSHSKRSTRAIPNEYSLMNELTRNSFCAMLSHDFRSSARSVSHHLPSGPGRRPHSAGCDARHRSSRSSLPLSWASQALRTSERWLSKEKEIPAIRRMPLALFSIVCALLRAEPPRKIRPLFCYSCTPHSRNFPGNDNHASSLPGCFSPARATKCNSHRITNLRKPFAQPPSRSQIVKIPGVGSRLSTLPILHTEHACGRSAGPGFRVRASCTSSGR